MGISPVLIFDLDDTLYREQDFFRGGIKAVVTFLSDTFSHCPDEITKWIECDLELHGRTGLFDRLIVDYALPAKLKKKLVQTYRFHEPNIELSLTTKDVLRQLGSMFPTYLITDGHKLVQRRKIDYLGLNNFILKSFVSNHYGLQKQKPSPYCYQLIRERENVTWNELTYVGDNPSKDFITLNKLGGRTIQTYQYVKNIVSPGSDFAANFIISELSELLRYDGFRFTID